MRKPSAKSRVKGPGVRAGETWIFECALNVSVRRAVNGLLIEVVVIKTWKIHTIKAFAHREYGHAGCFSPGTVQKAKRFANKLFPVSLICVLCHKKVSPFEGRCGSELYIDRFFFPLKVNIVPQLFNCRTIYLPNDFCKKSLNSRILWNLCQIFLAGRYRRAYLVFISLKGPILYKLQCAKVF